MHFSAFQNLVQFPDLIAKFNVNRQCQFIAGCGHTTAISTQAKKGCVLLAILLVGIAINGMVMPHAGGVVPDIPA